MTNCFSKYLHLFMFPFVLCKRPYCSRASTPHGIVRLVPFCHVHGYASPVTVVSFAPTPPIQTPRCCSSSNSHFLQTLQSPRIPLISYSSSNQNQVANSYLFSNYFKYISHSYPISSSLPLLGSFKKGPCGIILHYLKKC